MRRDYPCRNGPTDGDTRTINANGRDCVLIDLYISALRIAFNSVPSRSAREPRGLTFGRNRARIREIGGRSTTGLRLIEPTTGVGAF
jgi:hypothetical protein